MSNAAKPAYVYFVSPSPKTGPVKIGVTTNINKRLAQLQTSHHEKLQVIALITCDNNAHAYSLESKLHSKCASTQIRNEWFDINADDVEGLVKSIQHDHQSAKQPAKNAYREIEESPPIVIDVTRHARHSKNAAVFIPITHMNGRDLLALLDMPRLSNLRHLSERDNQ